MSSLVVQEEENSSLFVISVLKDDLSLDKRKQKCQSKLRSHISKGGPSKTNSKSWDQKGDMEKPLKAVALNVTLEISVDWIELPMN